MSISAVVLAVFAITGTGVVAWTFGMTQHRIADNERQALLRQLHVLIAPSAHDNVLDQDVISVQDRALLGSKKPVQVFRARMKDKPVAAILTPTAPDGYNGAIKLLVAIRIDGTLAGVRIVNHRETPGLGDAIDTERSDWILGFNDKSLLNPTARGWRVKRDGGDFDQFTGATITPRAVVKAVHKTLQYYQQHKDQLFVTNTSGSADEKK